MATSGMSDLLLAAPEVTFDVERFDWSGPHRLELAGRWSGVRGRRFVRPVLTVAVEGRRRRLVALLEHKPWSAEDGEPWVAAFAWEGSRDDVGPARLEVGPSLIVELPVPGPRQEGAEPPRPSPATLALQRAEEAEARAARETEAARTLIRREREEHERRRRELEEARAALESDVAAARAVADELRLELAGVRTRLEDALAMARTEADALREERDSARSASRAQADSLRAQQAALRREATAREHRLAEERNAATAERDRLAAARDAALELAEASDAADERAALARDLAHERARVRRLERRLAEVRAAREPAGTEDRSAWGGTTAAEPRPENALGVAPGAEAPTAGDPTAEEPTAIDRGPEHPGAAQATAAWTPEFAADETPAPGLAPDEAGSEAQTTAGPARSEAERAAGAEPSEAQPTAGTAASEAQPTAPPAASEAQPTAPPAASEAQHTAGPAAGGARAPGPAPAAPRRPPIDLTGRHAASARAAQGSRPPLLVQAEPLNRRSAAATWARRGAAFTLLAALVVVLALVAHLLG